MVVSVVVVSVVVVSGVVWQQARQRAGLAVWLVVKLVVWVVHLVLDVLVLVVDLVLKVLVRVRQISSNPALHHHHVLAGHGGVGRRN